MSVRQKRPPTLFPTHLESSRAALSTAGSLKLLIASNDPQRNELVRTHTDFYTLYLRRRVCYIYGRIVTQRYSTKVDSSSKAFQNRKPPQRRHFASCDVSAMAVQREVRRTASIASSGGKRPNRRHTWSSEEFNAELSFEDDKIKALAGEALAFCFPRLPE